MPIAPSVSNSITVRLELNAAYIIGSVFHPDVATVVTAAVDAAASSPKTTPPV